MVSLGQGYVGTILGLTLLLLLVVRLRAELVALLVLIALEIPGVLTRDEALSGFSNSAVITLIGLFVIGLALERTGVADQMAGLLVRAGGSSEGRLIPLVMLTTAALSLVMNNIAAGAVVLPAAVTVARRVRIPPAKLLMPLAFGASLGGMATIFTTANILVSNTLRASGLEPLSFLSFLPVGSLLVIAGVVYMVAVGRRFLPAGDPLAQVAGAASLPEVYQLQDRLWEVQIPPSSQLAGQTLGAADIGDLIGVTVVAIFHGQTTDMMPGPRTVLQAGDVLLVAGREDAVRELPGVTIGRETRARGYFTNPQVLTAEFVIGPRADIIGQTLKELEFRRRYGVTVIAVWQRGQAYRTHVGDLPLHAGDALLVVGPPDRLEQVAADPGLIQMTPLPVQRPRPHASKRPIALAITLLVLGLSAAQRLPTSIAVLLGVVLLVLTGCLTMDEALGSIEWKTIFVIAGLLPLSVAMQKTGLAATIGYAVVGSIGRYGFLALAAGLYLVTVALTQVLGGQVTALVMAPIAVATAAATGVSARNICIIVAMACSASFLTPLAHPVNLLVVTPGGYTFRDFMRVGGGLILVCFIVILLSTGLLPGG
jgi:di/tricarboxylate transporter